VNYRHGFHAGNFADVFKHALLVRLLVYLTRKEAAFRVIDTHAGEGAYDLSSEEAERTGEWRAGIARLADLSGASAEQAELLAPYLDIVGPFQSGGRPLIYPGSPLIAQKLLRVQDRAIFCELRTDAYEALSARFRRDNRIKTIHLDGYLGASAFTPPKERRGLVLIDPPFEIKNEFRAMLEAFRGAHRKWPTGVYALWHPIKDQREARAFYDALRRSGIARILRLSLMVGGDSERLRQTGLIIINPPFVFEEEARLLLPFLSQKLAQGPTAGFEIEWVAGE
jgi:23S rRNA (adenine2030-N6)-methyltransferase